LPKDLNKCQHHDAEVLQTIADIFEWNHEYCFCENHQEKSGSKNIDKMVTGVSGNLDLE
jgi:hypothetical protein